MYLLRKRLGNSNAKIMILLLQSGNALSKNFPVLGTFYEIPYGFPDIAVLLTCFFLVFFFVAGILSLLRATPPMNIS